ncbi:4Fe-4S binding protein [Anaerocolumna chitinilytica]|uniref:4Fe-4S ferredoxin-type domain-containing protein n=1 Tax=Anaerocolumna chitinilytica TaxID=1727145 RepID=A0A7I8DKX4_9FIRM|nr:4Fe-4S binding protein [Anaerocolumna chitinilytica]BCJ99083.1 hypothetical protein bsdcttw_21240 [Anaerocolumna chitinilytica]
MDKSMTGNNNQSKEWIEDGYYSINPDTCTNCGDCADICPVEIIKKR